MTQSLLSRKNAVDYGLNTESYQLKGIIIIACYTALESGHGQGDPPPPPPPLHPPVCWQKRLGMEQGIFVVKRDKFKRTIA
jgi:hypothetical protein